MDCAFYNAASSVLKVCGKSICTFSLFNMQLFVFINLQGFIDHLLEIFFSLSVINLGDYSED